MPVEVERKIADENIITVTGLQKTAVPPKLGHEDIQTSIEEIVHAAASGTCCTNFWPPT